MTEKDKVNNFWFERMFKNVKLAQGDTVYEIKKHEADFTKPVYEYKNKFYIIESEAKLFNGEEYQLNVNGIKVLSK